MNNTTDFSLNALSTQARTLTRFWLILAIASLIGAGLFSILLFLSRTPGVQDFIPWIDFFHIALVVHVDLSVLIWFLAFAGVLWSLNISSNIGSFGILPPAIAAIGTLLMIASPFLGAGDPLMNNYVPVLQHPLFFTALIIIGLGISLQVLRNLFIDRPGLTISSGSDALRLGSHAAAFTTLLAILAVAYSYFEIPDEINGSSYYELLFWSGGHILQFTHTILVIVVWLVLASASGIIFTVNSKLTASLLCLIIAPLLTVPFIIHSTDITSPEQRLAFTELMTWGGLLSLPLGLMIVFAILKARRATGTNIPLRAALLSSIILFGTGGVIGFLINGINVVIPAHYHGSIVGVTLAYMGLTYYLLPLLGYRLPMQPLANWQPWISGGGQMLHIIGLAWSGGYGVARKTAGTEQGLDRLPEILGMGLMGFGGLITTIGGVLFLVIIIKAMWPDKK